MKSENNNSFTIQTTNGGAQDYTIFAKEEEAQIPADQLVSGMSYWARENVINYKTVDNPFLDSVQFKEPQNPVNAKLKAIYTEAVDNASLNTKKYYFKEEQSNLPCNPLNGMEKLTWKVIEPLFAKTDSGLSVKYSRDLSMFFNGCKSLRWCDVRKGLKVTNNTKVIEYFFSGCESLRAILGLTSWDISGITDFDYMFFNCKNLQWINICTWNTSHVEDFRSMFGLCSNLKTINGVIDLSSAVNYTGMFASCDSLTGVKLKNVPADFDFGRAGLKPGQYEIVDPFYVDPVFFEYGYRDNNDLLIADWGTEETHHVSDEVPLE
jgi:adhesin-like protein